MFNTDGEFLRSLQLPDLTQLVFIVAFILAVITGTGLYGSFVNTKKESQLDHEIFI